MVKRGFTRGGDLFTGKELALTHWKEGRDSEGQAEGRRCWEVSAGSALSKPLPLNRTAASIDALPVFSPQIYSSFTF